MGDRILYLQQTLGTSCLPWSYPMVLVVIFAFIVSCGVTRVNEVYRTNKGKYTTKLIINGILSRILKRPT